MMKVSVVVPAFNEEKMLPACLKSLASQTYPCEIVVCDNNSIDATRMIARKYAHVVVSERRQGAPYAIDRGIKASGGELIAVTGADCVVPPDWISRFVSAFGDEKIIACYGPIDPLEGNHKTYFSCMNIAEKALIKMKLWFIVQGANFMARKSVIDEVGFLDENVKLFEENGFMKKIRKKGKIMFLDHNRVKASTRRMQNVGISSLMFIGIKEMAKLSLMKKTDARGFENFR